MHLGQRYPPVPSRNAVSSSTISAQPAQETRPGSLPLCHAAGSSHVPQVHVDGNAGANRVVARTVSWPPAHRYVARLGSVRSAASIGCSSSSGAAGVCGVRCSIGTHAEKPKRGIVGASR